MTDYNGYIDSIDLLNTFNRFMTSAETKNIFPASFQSVRPRHVEEMIHILDPKHKGKILTSKFMTILALQNTKLPSQKELESYQRGVTSMANTEGLIKYRDFEEVKIIQRQLTCQIPAWFDDSQQEAKQYPLSNPFDRLGHLKKIIFEIHSNKVSFCFLQTRA